MFEASSQMVNKSRTTLKDNFTSDAFNSSSSSSAVAEPCHNYNFDEVEFTCLLSLAIFQLSISAGSALRYGEGIGEKACANKTGEVHGLLEVSHVTHLKTYRAQ